MKAGRGKQRCGKQDQGETLDRRTGESLEELRRTGKRLKRAARLVGTKQGANVALSVGPGQVTEVRATAFRVRRDTQRKRTEGKVSGGGRKRQDSDEGGWKASGGSGRGVIGPRGRLEGVGQ
ncbi:hypothetical protein TRVL_06382 [Trypanosoma vivax]|nr:hypothetical protein TRVL_06382 [Trypanosoma vivax]